MKIGNGSNGSVSSSTIALVWLIALILGLLTIWGIYQTLVALGPIWAIVLALGILFLAYKLIERHKST